MLLLLHCGGNDHTEWKNLCLEGNTVRLYIMFMWYVEFFFNGVFSMKVLELEKVVVCIMVAVLVFLF